MRKRLKLGRPSHATVVAYLALFVALGSGAYATSQFPKNSVGPKQLKKNAVRTAKIKNNAVTLRKIKKNSINSAKVKNNSLTGADINLNKLGTVPSANVANTANALAPLEPSHLVGAPGEPAFEGGSGNVPAEAGSLQPVGFYKDHEGIVHLQGLALVGALGLIPSIFTLPEGYRPASTRALFFTVFCLVGEDCDDGGGDSENYSFIGIAGSNVSDEGIQLSGRVISQPNTVISLDGVTFRAES